MSIKAAVNCTWQIEGVSPRIEASSLLLCSLGLSLSIGMAVAAVLLLPSNVEEEEIDGDARIAGGARGGVAWRRSRGRGREEAAWRGLGGRRRWEGDCG
jgi:hypothetical protein